MSKPTKAANVDHQARPSARYVCPDCQGPSASYKGIVHKWRCRECVAYVLGIEQRPDRTILEYGEVR